MIKTIIIYLKKDIYFETKMTSIPRKGDNVGVWVTSMNHMLLNVENVTYYFDEKFELHHVNVELS